MSRFLYRWPLICALWTLIVHTPEVTLADPAGELAPANAVTLVREGEPQCTIVVNKTPGRIAVMAAAELQWHIKKITEGTIVPVVRDGEPVKGIPIYVGESMPVREAGLKNHQFSAREFAIKFLTNGIVLAGCDDPSDVTPEGTPLDLSIKPFDMGPNRGTLFATYEFIESVLGVRWYAPGRENISLPPHTRTLTVMPVDIRRTPAILDRNAPFGVNVRAWGEPEPTTEEKALFHLRNKQAGQVVIAPSFEGWPERFEQKDSPHFESSHPEYFSQDQKEAQLCFTSTGTLNQAIADARRWADGKGLTYLAKTGEDWYGLEPRDTPVTCTCDGCKAMMGPKDEFNSADASRIVWTFADKVARALQETNPGKFVGVLANGNHAGIPADMDLATNIYIGMSLFTRNWPPEGGHDSVIYQNWLKKAPGRIHSLWLYPCFPRETAGIQGYTAFPVFEARDLNRKMRTFATDQVRSFMFCGSYDTALDYWCTLKFQDNPFVDVEATIHEYFQRYYGAAADPMEKLYNGIEAAYWNYDQYPDKTPRADEANSWSIIGTDERMAQWQILMDVATSNAVSELEKKRVGSFRDNLWAEMCRGKQAGARTQKYKAEVEELKKLPPAETNVMRLAATPKDADARHVDWDKIPVVPITRTIAGYPTDVRTADFQITHDGSNIYMRVKDRVKPSKLVDSGCAWLGDRWEMFISAQRPAKDTEDRNQWGPYRQIGVRPNAKTPDLWTSSPNDAEFWSSQDLKLSFNNSDSRWRFHLTIPMQTFSSAGPVKPGDTIYINLIGVNADAGSVIALSPTFNPGTFHSVPRHMGFVLQP